MVSNIFPYECALDVTFIDVFVALVDSDVTGKFTLGRLKPMESAVARACNGGLGEEGVRCPHLEADSFFVDVRPQEWAN